MQNSASAILLFDGDCSLCNRSVQFILHHEEKPIIQFAALQSPVADELLKNFFVNKSSFNTVIFIENQQVFTRSKAVFAIAKYLKFPFNLLDYFRWLPHRFSDFFYNIIAKYRYKVFGKTANCILLKNEWKHRFLTS
ncbi:MAG: thiol-disulfide oxidoreductase DCC family protein [Chitinophagaceae bacterium]